MPEAAIDVERVVREVLAELRRLPQAGAASAAPSSATVAKPPAEPATAPGELTVTCRVVTMAELDGRLAGIRRVVAPPQAIVTPAVRDELDRRGIAMGFAPSPVAAGSVLPRLVLVAHGSEADPAPLAALLGKEGIAVEPQKLECVIRATDLLAEEVRRPATLGLLLTRHTAAALCLANRHAGVRAVAGCDLRSAAQAVGANLLVIDPAAMSLFQLKQMAGEFCRGGCRPCPDVFRRQLG